MSNLPTFPEKAGTLEGSTTTESHHRRLQLEREGGRVRVAPPERQTISEPVETTIRRGDIVGAWTGILFRYGYMRLS